MGGGDKGGGVNGYIVTVLFKVMKKSDDIFSLDVW
jgi:hypothetical protein